MNYDYSTVPYSYWHVPKPRDDRFFELVKAMSVAMADRCQEGLLGPEEFGKTVVAAAGCVMVEFLYANGERRRPLSPEEQAKEIKRLMESLKK